MIDPVVDEPDRWHLSPRVTMAVLGWLFSATLAGVAWAVSVSRDLAVLQAQVTIAKADNERQDSTSADALRLMREELRDVRGELRALRDVLQRERVGRP